ncbi:multidrug resistance-associated ABC transporter [Hymenopellis radicata]|nr:multidrug resistance-associated ABC transporter [Hymenopellis radicata]
MNLCNGSGALDFHDTCVRGTWATIPATVLVAVFCLFSLPIKVPDVIRQTTKLFRTFLSLHEAEALDIKDEQETLEILVVVPVWRTVVFALLGLVEALCWVGDGSYRAVAASYDVWGIMRAFLIAATWLYTVVRPVVAPAATPQYDVFVVYIMHLVGGILLLGGALYDTIVFGFPLPHGIILVGLYANPIITIILLAVVMSIPIDVPSSRVKPVDIGMTVSPEDYTTLFGWVTFSWVYPLVQKGRNTTLQDADVWNLSPTYQSRPLFIKFNNIVQSSLLRKIVIANLHDLLLDAGLTFISTIFNYSVPFFMSLILTTIDVRDRTAEDTTRAYIYALLMFVCTVAKAQADLHHLWFGRRAGTHMRSELIASIYDKALKRKDFSGIVDKTVEQKAEAPGTRSAEDKKKEEKADDPKAGAGAGKIVNLMASDSSKIAGITSSAYYIYGAPLEIVIGSVFLYQLLGWSAFTGFFVLLLGWPLNSILTRQRVRIQKGIMTASDKRMGVLNELIGAVKFIKFFAWEDKWIKKAMDVRDVEMNWIVKSRINSILIYMLWNSAPVLISIVVFFTYVVQGNELTISKAFTSISLFSMIRVPLNIIPAWIMQILQLRIIVKRIEVYLGEEEVTDQVSSLKKDASARILLEPDEEGLGLRNATLKWNEVEEKQEDAGHHAKASIASSTVDTRNGSGDESTLGLNGSDVMDHKFELKDITVMFPEGELSIITGPTASGKTALLMAVLGEMTLTSGMIIMSKDISRIDKFGNMHAISYAAQSPWLRHQSIKDNILFGYPLDEARYQTVIEACALRPDLRVLEDGDMTEIGAKGVSLSGGQKARVALARAVYARTKYVLLDDPLSAVDSHTSRFLFERLLMGPLLKDRTVVLVTHHVELVLPGAQYLVRMLDGRIDTQGYVKDLKVQGTLDEIARDESTEAHAEGTMNAPEEVVADEVDSEDRASDGTERKPRKLVKDEHREKGSVKWNIYRKYLQASSYFIWSILLILVFFNQGLSIVEKLWIKFWGEAYGKATASFMFRSASSHDQEIMTGAFSQGLLHHHSPGPVYSTSALPDAREHPLFYVGVYAAIGIGSAMVGVASSAAQYTGALRASRTLFKQLLGTVVRATFRFHDTTPQGRILNRFGKDIESIDSRLAGSMQAVNSSLAAFLVSILTVAVVFPAFLIPAALLGLVYRELAIGYLNTGRDLRRMESNSRSPIFSHFGEVLEGIVTVRAFSAEKRFLDNLHRKVDATTKVWYNFWMTNRWLLLNFDCLGAVGVLITCLFSITVLVDNAGLAGLCITSALSFTTSVYWACRYWTELELDLNSVERIVEYLDLPQEPPAVIESSRPPAYWPSRMTNDNLVTVENLVVKYAPELPAVLHGVSFSLRAGERIGLLGRTGSGKSTLATSILRFVDPTEGRIIIDGIDISKIGVHDLRERLTFIPQDATLFSGTLRENLDPFNEHDDNECWEVLYRVQMVTTSQMPSEAATPATSRPASIRGVERAPAEGSVVDSIATDMDSKTSVSLQTKVSPGGTNFSQGQRQLIAMARALLRHSSIIVLDEATSSIDFATDAKIQKAIRDELTNSLLLTVAHRLRTVIDYDRLIVLDKGRVAEFDTPLNLIRKEDSMFRNMCLKSGTFGELEAAATAKAKRDEK